MSREVVFQLIDSLNQTGNPPWETGPARFRLIKKEGTAYLFKNEAN